MCKILYNFQAIRHVLHTEVLAKLKLHEMYICDSQKLTIEFLNLSRSKVIPVPESKIETENLTLLQDPQFRRFGSGVDMSLALKLFNVYR